MYVASEAVLCLQALHLSNGVVISSGDGLTQVVPVFEGKLCYDFIF